VSLNIVALAFNPAPHTGGDNATYLSLAYSLVDQGSYRDVFDPAGLPHTIYPPVFPAILAALMLLGARTWIAFKVVAALSAVATVAVTFLWAEKKVGAGWASGVAITLAFSSALIYHSHYILSDATFLFFTVLALYALEQADEPAAGDDASAAGAQARWMALGIGAAGLAYFTRSAGLPLLVALGAWLVLRRRWRALAAVAAVWGAPIVLWWLRSRAFGQDGYAEEFWLLNPYNPAEGRVSAFGLLQRMGGNVWEYLGTHVPQGIARTGPVGGAVIGVFAVGLGLAGWTRVVLKKIGPTELFLPLYTGLILLWPDVWSGDRFALPLYPILYIYGARLLREVRLGPIAPALTGAVACAVLVLPAMRSLPAARSEANLCRERGRIQGPFGCYAPNVHAFVDAAAWSRAHLPPGSAVLTRKPSIFYVLSGLPSRMFPFDLNPSAHLAVAEEAGARYVLVDRWDEMAEVYVQTAMVQRAGSFCVMRDFGGGTILFAILPPEGQREAVVEGTTAYFEGCPEDYVMVGVPEEPPSPSYRIPLLEGL
jgi:hypothetical protein